MTKQKEDNPDAVFEKSDELMQLKQVFDVFIEAIVQDNEKHNFY